MFTFLLIVLACTGVGNHTLLLASFRVLHQFMNMVLTMTLKILEHFSKFLFVFISVDDVVHIAVVWQAMYLFFGVLVHEFRESSKFVPAPCWLFLVLTFCSFRIRWEIGL